MDSHQPGFPRADDPYSYPDSAGSEQGAQEAVHLDLELELLDRRCSLLLPSVVAVGMSDYWYQEERRVVEVDAWEDDPFDH